MAKTWPLFISLWDEIVSQQLRLTVFSAVASVAALFYCEELMMAERKTLTGYPSIDKPWLKYYKDNAEVEANDIPLNRCVWDVIEENLYKHIDVPAIEYFGQIISRKDFIDNVYLWARAFKNMGIKENEVVAYYGPFLPDVCFMLFALNMLGACPYFLKLAISSDALAEETKECRIAIVFDQMWKNVQSEFSKDRFEKVIILKATDYMPSPKKQLVSVLSRLKTNNDIPKKDKYITSSQALKYARNFIGEVKVPFVAARNAFITSSSGTTVNGVVKGVIATNESVLAQLKMGDASGIQYFPGDRCLNNFPPTASTALNSLFLWPLYNGMTVVIDPRVSERDFYNQIIKLKPNAIITTGSMWEVFFRRVEAEIKKGKSFDFSYNKCWAVGGEGTSKKKLLQWDQIMNQCNSSRIVASAYGASELFSAVSSDWVHVNSNCDNKYSITGVGIPFAGVTIGAFDEYGNELKYGDRGELYVKSNSMFKEYYNKPELTNKTLVNGWVHTGDMAFISEDGFLFICGRLSDCINSSYGKKVYLFDLSENIKEFDFVSDAMVLPWNGDYSSKRVSVHLVWNGLFNNDDKLSKLKQIETLLKDILPADIFVEGYAEYEEMLPYSPTTLKKDRNKMATKTSELDITMCK